MTTDQELVSAILAGDEAAFERLVVTHQQQCWRIIVRLVRDPDHATDLCQETFLRAHQRLHQFRGDSQLKTWLGRIAYSIALRFLERQQGPVIAPGANDAMDQAQDLASDELRPDAALAQHELRQHLDAAIDSLAPVPRSILKLYHVDELSIPQIAVVTGLPEGTVKSHLFRARLRLRELMDPGFGDFA